ncbi:MAG TPA: efflux RND transporter periplasmic adaptor subunit [Phycisphaerae bacterium]|nr:efflux RND transporter periplasmic adaptor subunit [Phycisphaerae bacterium]
MTVQAEKAVLKPLTESVSAESVLTPQAQAAIVPRISAPVKAFFVLRGAHVARGQLLATLEHADLDAAVRDSHGALKQADATYVTTTKAGVVEDLQKARLDLAQARANLEVAQNVFNARENLLKEGAIPRRDFETAQAALVQARAAFDIADQHLNSLNAVSQTATIQNAEGARESAQGKYEAAQAALGYSEIRSPIDGVVTDRPLFAGEMANAGQPIVTVMDISTLIAKIHLSPEQAAALKLGDEAAVTIPGGEEPVKGKLTLISPALDTGSTTLEVWVAIPNKDGRLKVGTSVHVAVSSRSIQNALCIPNEALIATKAGSPAVMVIGVDGVANHKAVKTGITDGHATQILSGLAAGEQVVTKGAYGMDDGTRVKIAAADAGDDEKPSAGSAGDEK